MKSRWPILFVLFLQVYILFNRAGDWKDNSIYYDKFGYYSYLPALFIYNDLAHLSVYPIATEKYHYIFEWYSTHEIEATGRRLNKYAIGTCLFELPAFLVAHACTINSKQYPADGLSYPYQLAIGLSSIFCTVIGLAYLLGFLRSYFSNAVSTIIMLCIGFGTNLYTYTVFDFGMSHPISFMLVCAMLYYTRAWYTGYKAKHLYALAITMGLIAITRPVNIVTGIIPLFWGVNNTTLLKGRFNLYFTKWKNTLIALTCFALVLLIQMGYWKYITGHWVYYSYEDEGFNFKHSQWLKGLFGFRKGWFVYTPLAFLGVIGLVALWLKYRKLVPSILLCLIPMIYIIFSWGCWWYGGGFGSRATIELLPILALPLAALVEYLGRKNLAVKIMTGVVLTFFVALNMFQSYQFGLQIQHYDRMTAAYYWRIFGKLEATDEDRKYLMTDEEVFRDGMTYIAGEDANH